MLENISWSEEQKDVIKTSEFTKISISDAIYTWVALEHVHYKRVQVR